MIRFSYLMAVFLLCVVPAYANKVVNIDTICKDVDNTSFCSTLLKSKHGADLVTLAQYTIDVAFTNVTNIVNLITKLISEVGGDPEAKSHYESCLNHFGNRRGVLSLLEDAEKSLKSGDYFSMRMEAEGMIGDCASCIEGEGPSDPPYPDKSLLPNYAQVVKDIAEILIVISNFLVE